MEKRAPTQHRKKNVLRQAKQLILVLSVASTLGFWVLFTHKPAQELTALANQPEGNSSDPLSQTDHRLSLNLPPLPTLVPPLDSASGGSQSFQLNNQVPQVLTQPSVPQSGTFFMGGAKPRVSQGNPITVTRSSR